MRGPASAPPELTVLYIDSSIGFGGAIKSLALTLREMPGVEPILATSQDADLVRQWLPGVRLIPFRRVVNYRSKDRVIAWFTERVSANLFRRLLGKLIGVTDILAAVTNAARMAWLIRRRRVDLVHLNNGFRPLEGLIAADIAGVPCVVHARGFQFARERAKSRWARRVAAVIAVSDSVAGRIHEVRKGERVFTVHDPVDIVAMERASSARPRIRKQHGIADDEVVVAIFGRVVRWKGQAEFVKAVLEAMRSSGVIRAMIVGNESDGTRDYYDQVMAAINQSRRAHRFIIAEYRPNVEEYYAAADIVVHASVTPEPFGMVVIEGMAAGCAVIAMDAGGPREIITQGIDGVLVPPGDTSALAQAILELSEDAPRRRRVGECGRRTAVQRFGIANSAEGVRAVYDRVLTDVR